MKQVIRKFYGTWHYEREEAWLNDMSTGGWQLTGVGLMRYTFEEGTPGAYRYRVRFRNERPEAESGGAEQLGAVYSRVYYRQKACDSTIEPANGSARFRPLAGITALHSCLLLFWLYWVIYCINFLQQKDNSSFVFYSTLIPTLFFTLLFCAFLYSTALLCLKLISLKRSAAARG